MRHVLRPVPKIKPISTGVVMEDKSPILILKTWQPPHRPRDTMARGAVNLWTVGCADARLTTQAWSPMDKPEKTHSVSPAGPQVGGCPQASQRNS